NICFVGRPCSEASEKQALALAQFVSRRLGLNLPKPELPFFRAEEALRNPEALHAQMDKVLRENGRKLFHAFDSCIEVLFRARVVGDVKWLGPEVARYESYRWLLSEELIHQRDHEVERAKGNVRKSYALTGDVHDVLKARVVQVTSSFRRPARVERLLK